MKLFCQSIKFTSEVIKLNEFLHYLLHCHYTDKNIVLESGHLFLRSFMSIFINVASFKKTSCIRLFLKNVSMMLLHKMVLD